MKEERELYFSYFPEDNEFEEHNTLQEAINRAQEWLEYYREDACEDGWDEAVSNICYGKILGGVVYDKEFHRENYTEEEWEEMFPYNSGHDLIVDYKLEGLIKRTIEDIRELFHAWIYSNENVLYEIVYDPGCVFEYEDRFRCYTKPFIDMGLVEEFKEILYCVPEKYLTKPEEK